MGFDMTSYIIGAKSGGSGGGGGGGGGSGGGAFVVEMVWDESTSTYTLDTKAGVIFNAAKTGLVIFQEKVDGEVVAVYLLNYCYNDMEAGYGFYVYSSGPMAFMANSADDYPRSTDG